MINDKIYCCPFFDPIWRIYKWFITIRVCFIKFVIQQINTIKDGIATFNWFFNWLFGEVWISDSKCSLIILSVLSEIMICMLPLFKCITNFSSLSWREIQLIAIVNWVFVVSYFLALFMMSFKNGLLLSTYSLIDGVFFLSPLLSIRCNCYILQNHSSL